MQRSKTPAAREARLRRAMKRQGLRLRKRGAVYELLDWKTGLRELPGKLLTLADIDRLLFAGRSRFAGYIPESEMIRPPDRFGCAS